jgi:molecular chaperone GrpE
MKRKPDVNTDSATNEEMPDQNQPVGTDTEGLPDSSVEFSDNVSKLEADLTAANDKYLRLYSDFDNYKKRIAKERTEVSRMATADMLLSFLPVIDDLERALKSAENSDDAAAIKEGVNLIYSKIKNMTSSKGLTPMDAVGKSFDPELHDAIANIPVPESDDGKVIEEIEKGYFLNDRVIRHAKVIVGKSQS